MVLYTINGHFLESVVMNYLHIYHLISILPIKSRNVQVRFNILSQVHLYATRLKPLYALRKRVRAHTDNVVHIVAHTAKHKYT